MGKDQFVVRNGDQWAVRGANNQRVIAIFSTQAEAIKVATGIAKNQQSELRVQDRHGKFKKCNSYGNDPCPPKDKNL